MKKILFIASIVISAVQFSKAQTATNFNANDCLGNNHDLFTELNAGKVIVIAWVMPCISCISGALTGYTEAQNYPGQTYFYLADDYANTSCTSLTSWANTNGMPSCNAIFSSTAVNQSGYGIAGMPKVIVLGGASHTVYYNQNEGSITQSGIQNAINTALADIANGVKENYVDNFQFSVFPNPVTNKKTTVTYNLKGHEEISIDVYNTIGAKVKSILKEEQTVGKHEQIIDLTSLSRGVYFIKLHAGNKTDVLKIVISE